MKLLFVLQDRTGIKTGDKLYTLKSASPCRSETPIKVKSHVDIESRLAAKDAMPLFKGVGDTFAASQVDAVARLRNYEVTIKA